MVDKFKPDYVAPVVGYLVSEGMWFMPPLVSYADHHLANQETNGKLFEVSGGWAAEVRWQRSGGHGFPHNKELTPEAVISKWDLITGFCEDLTPKFSPVLTFYAADGHVTYPTSTQESIQRVFENVENIVSGNSPSNPIAEALKVVETTEFTYNDQDVILYNLGVGATEKDVQWIFEGHDQFQALPTFGVIPQFPASSGLSLDFLPNFNLVSFQLNPCMSLTNELRTDQATSWRAVPRDQRPDPHKCHAR